MIEELRAQLTTAQEQMSAAERAGLEYQVHMHRARIDDLIEIALRHGIDLKPWPDQPLITHASSDVQAAG